MDATDPADSEGPSLVLNPSLPRFCHYPGSPAPARVRLMVTPEHPCAYLPGRLAQNRAFWAEQMPGATYHAFMDAAFRRSGRVIYQPICRGCRECRPIRVPVPTFRASKSQRRCWRRNADVQVTTARPVATDEKFDLYRRYLRDWHGRSEGAGAPARDDATVDPTPADLAEERSAFEDFLYDSPVDTVETEYRDSAGRLLGVGICDVCADSLSSVYFYHDPADAGRGLGTYSALQEIEEARRLGIPYYYLGYWVKECGPMRYKSSFGPNEILHHDGVWRSSDISPTTDGAE